MSAVPKSTFNAILNDVRARHDRQVEDLALAIREGAVDRLRVLSPASQSSMIDAVCAETFVSTIKEQVVKDGYVETLRYLNEQSVSFDYHRYGNLGDRANEARAEPQ